jgi:hypothetical protein
MNVVNITEKIAVNKIKEILNLNTADSIDFYKKFKSGNTLAETLRSIGIISSCQIKSENWEQLRRWRDIYFPGNIKGKKK